MTTEPNTIKQGAVVSNIRDVSVDVWFEPWGMNHMLAAGGSFELEIESEIEGQIEIVESNDSIAVYSFPTSTIKIFRNGSLIDDLNVKFPVAAMPNNMSTKEMIGFLFGGPGLPRPSQDDM
ncbi:MAG: hypothetical protein DWH91_13760 [Planctomycetota bacterium]|nr:MAG: hypothetical protein DWH91_13760 [Planctomycetota bacterium]